MECRYDYDVKDDFIHLLNNSNVLDNSKKLSRYMQMYQNTQDENKRNLIKFLLFKLSINFSDANLRDFDCDSCKGVTASYGQTYSWLKDYTFQNQRGYSVKFEYVKEERYRGDTMTSAWTVIKKYIQLKTGVYRIAEKDMWELFMLNYIDKFNLSDNAGAFLKYCHTIGNFIPVPRGFNAGRSNFGKWDSWDLTLTQIYLWFKSNEPRKKYLDNSALEKLFINDGNNMRNSLHYCLCWLKKFTSWEDFVKRNYLESFLCDNGKPKLFFKNHSLSNPLPKTLDEFECFFKTVNNCIIQRGQAITTFISCDKNAENNKTNTVTNNAENKCAKDSFIKKIRSFGPIDAVADVIEDLICDPVENLNLTFTKLAIVSAIIYGIVMFVNFIVLGGYAEKWGIITRHNIPEMLSFTFNLGGAYYCNVWLGIILSLLILSLMAMCFKGVVERHGVKRVLLSIISIIGWVGIIPVCIAPFCYDPIMQSNAMEEWQNQLVSSMGYDNACEYYKKTIADIINIYCIVAIVVLVIFLSAILFTCLINSVRGDLFFCIKVFFFIILAMPLILFVLENIIIIPIIVLFVGACFLYSSFTGGSSAIELDVFTKEGNYFGTITSDDIKNKETTNLQ